MRPTLEVARDLLGTYIVVENPEGRMVGEINEVEAYVGAEDPACHAAAGKTKRNEVMFREGGHLYIYFTYGMHYCMNIVTENEGFPAAVLIRSIIPLEGADLMRKNRLNGSKAKNVQDKNLANGPAKVCQALKLNLADNGLDTMSSQKVHLMEGEKKALFVKETVRIGIKVGKEKLWRFVC